MRDLLNKSLTNVDDKINVGDNINFDDNISVDDLIAAYQVMCALRVCVRMCVCVRERESVCVCVPHGCLFNKSLGDTGLLIVIGCLIFIGHFPQKSPIING